MTNIAYYIRENQLEDVLKNMDIGSGSNKIHKMIENADASKVYVITNYGKGRVVVAEINIKESYEDKHHKWAYRVKGDEKSKKIDPPIPFVELFPDKPFTYPVIRYV
ncbi:MAG: hypothetical protein Q8O41_08555 [Candidatus Methanoperedens sp.]|nr:hypothetical protein [Candidatus Methanoperedens sp.]